MALDAGILNLTIEYAQGLKDQDWFGRMDPYAIIKVGQQTFRTRTVKRGGTSPVFNETFRFNVLSENDFYITLKDEDLTIDDFIGVARGDLARVRYAGTDRLTLPVVSRRGRNHGTLIVSLRFESNAALLAAHGGLHQQQYMQLPYAQPPTAPMMPQQYMGVQYGAAAAPAQPHMYGYPVQGQYMMPHQPAYRAATKA